MEDTTELNGKKTTVSAVRLKMLTRDIAAILRRGDRIWFLIPTKLKGLGKRVFFKTHSKIV